MKTINLQELNAKKEKLNALAIKLKQEFFGIDGCIDKIIESIKTWYLLPEIISRPAIINLWGLTGVGKTALVRILAKELGFSDRFIEIQMDGVSGGTTKSDSICSILENSSVNESQPGIILLDEFQRFRTLDETGKEMKVERFQDVWMLLSDGKFPSDHSSLAKIEQELATMDYYKDYEDYNKEVKKEENEKNKVENAEIKVGSATKIKRKFTIYPYEAKMIKKMLRLTIPIQEVMKLNTEDIRSLIQDHLQKNGNKPIDYSKSLIFIGGNLDEAFKMADSVEDCDTDADIFYKHSLKISVIEVKSALAKRFKPEQIARLGNNHIIYPSLSKDAYYKIIQRTCLRYTEDAFQISGIKISPDQSIYDALYQNSVYPTQGTRPVFTSIHKMFGSPISDAILWALENQITSVKALVDLEKSNIIFTNGITNKSCYIDFEIKNRKALYSPDYKALVAVHEAGHALAYALLFKTSPSETKINVASYKGGYMISEGTTSNKIELLNRVIISLAGLVAEEILFGPDLRSVGCKSDMAKATELIAAYVRTLGMDGYSSYIFKDQNGSFNQDIDGTNAVIEQIVKDQKAKTFDLMTKNRNVLIKISKKLLSQETLKKDEFFTLFKDDIIGLTNVSEVDTSGNYHEILSKL